MIRHRRGGVEAGLLGVLDPGVLKRRLTTQSHPSTQMPPQPADLSLLPAE